MKKVRPNSEKTLENDHLASGHFILCYNHGMHPWIVSKSFDLCLFAGTYLVGPFCYGLFVTQQGASWSTLSEENVLIFFMLFTAIFDAPHIFQTFYRTHWDGLEFPRRRFFHSFSVLLAIGVALFSDSIGLRDLFLTLLGVYGSWHILKQNIGFVKLYGIKIDEDRIQTKWRIWTLYFLLLFVLLNETNPVNEVFQRLREFHSLYISLWLLSLAGLLLGLFQTLRRDVKKFHLVHIFFYATIFNFVFLSYLNIHILIMTALGTMAHNIQYQAWMWLYERRQSQNKVLPWGWLLGTLSLGVLLAFPTTSRLNIQLMQFDWLTMTYNGLVLWHYFIDGRIWRFSQMPELKVMVS